MQCPRLSWISPRLVARGCYCSVHSTEGKDLGRNPVLCDVARRLRNYKPPAKGVYGNFTQLLPPPGVEEASTGKASESFPWRHRAGVLICLFLDREMDFKVILTKRTGSLSSHSGEVALPGGKLDPSDKDEVAAALREADEEIGLKPSLVEVVTQMEPFISKLLVRVVPVIGLLPHRDRFVPKLNRDEVASMFEAPIEMFLKDENHKVGERTLLGQPHPVHYFHFDCNGEKYLIWGATAAILIRAAGLVYEREPDFSSPREE